WLDLDEAARTRSRAPLEFEETGLSSSRVYEFFITEDSPAAGQAIKDLDLPENVLVYLIRRDGLFILPRGGTVIQPEDDVLLMMEPHIASRIESVFLTGDQTKKAEPATASCF
ncbi:MAG: hypothetical protein J6A23_13220, partial [Thermoguttaceae bacterium]|nr:hypothetical protein [Thermoguttaceae bacterium]